MSISQSEFAVKYVECGNAYEAAMFAGASSRAQAAFEGVRLLASKTVRSKIAALKKERELCPAEQGLRRIAFGRNNDAIKLAFAQEITDELIDSSDLYGVSEIKVGKGVVEIKFFDRLKALDALYSAQKEEHDEDQALNLVRAIYSDEGSECN